MPSLVKALPELVSDLENALIRIGRGDAADQLREVEVERWTYDEEADAGYIYVKSPRILNAIDQNIVGVKHGETLCPFEDYGIFVHLDNHHRLRGIELLGASSTIALLEKSIAI